MMKKAYRNDAVDILCKRVDRALVNLSKNNVIVLANFDHSDDSFILRVIRYSMDFKRIHTPENRRVFTRPSDKCDDIVYVPCRSEDLGSGTSWFVDIRCREGVSPRLVFSSPLFHRSGEFVLCENLVSVFSGFGRFFNTLRFAAGCFGFDDEYLGSFGVDPKFYNMNVQDIDALPSVLVDPKNTAKDIKEIVRNYFNIDVPKVKAFVETSADRLLQSK